MYGQYKMYKKVPTYKDGEWTYTNFKTVDDFKKFLVTLFKETCQYRFDETALLFNEVKLFTNF